MIKNITVVDETGETYEATYPKRAKGLVKKGRARFVNETTICLAHPPDMEGKKVSSEWIGTENCQEEMQRRGLNDGYIMEKIDQILRDGQYIKQAIAQMETANEAAAMALANIAEYRERTNQSMIHLLEQMLAGLLKPADPQIEKAQMLLAFIQNNQQLDEDCASEMLTDIVQKIL
jgi:hypothetical protein